MKILITPDDIIKRGCWDSYVYYIIGSDKDAHKLLEDNEEIDMSENDALVIGLLKVIETNNLIHKFNTYITEILSNKSSKQEKTLMIRKKTLDFALEKFLNKFPDYWNPNDYWLVPLGELRVYIDNMKVKIDNLEIHTISERNFVSEFYTTNNVKKLLKFNY
jgi:hypothetical protein